MTITADSARARVREAPGWDGVAGARRVGDGITVRSLNHHAGDGAFNGRVAELEQLRVALEGLTDGRSARLLIAGEVGIGKSRLVAEALARPSLAGLAVLIGRAPRFERDRPFGLFVDALDLHASSANSERAAIGRLIVRARDPLRADLRHALIPRITHLVGRLSVAGSLALLLEDLQWADPLSVGIISALLEGMPERALGMVMTTRLLPINPVVEEILSRPQLGVERLDLEGLPVDAVAALIRTVTGGDPASRLSSLAAAAGGNPGYLISLLNGLRQEGALWVEGGIADTDAIVPPRTMYPAVMARIAQLSDGCQDLLTIAAVLAQPFSVSSLAAAANRAVPDLLTNLREAMAAAILGDADGALRFREELVRTVLYETTPAATRSSLHLRIGNSLLANGGDARAVAYHLLRGVELEGTPQPFEERTGVTVPSVPSGLEKLTSAERQIVRHVVEGLSNRVIGQWLFVSPRTVETHLSNIYAKLGVRSRVELVTVVSRRMGTFARVESRIRDSGRVTRSASGLARPASPTATTKAVVAVDGAGSDGRIDVTVG